MEVEARLRRTSARGWGPWCEATLVLGAPPDGGARWRVAEPVAVGLPSTNGPVDEAFDGDAEIYVRAARFRTEQFWRGATDIVVVASEGSRVEVAAPGGLADAIAERLSDLRRSPG